MDRLADLGTIGAALERKRRGENLGIDLIALGAELFDLGSKSQNTLVDQVFYQRFLSNTRIEEDQTQPERPQVNPIELLEGLRNLAGAVQPAQAAAHA
jgi:hypothetical protein